MAVDRMESKSEWVIFTSFWRLFHPPATQYKMCKCIHLLQDLQCRDVLVVTTQSPPCIQEKYRAMNWYILMTQWLTKITWAGESSLCLLKGVTAAEMPHVHPCLRQLCATTKQPSLASTLTHTHNSASAPQLLRKHPTAMPPPLLLWHFRTEAWWILPDSCNSGKPLPHKDDQFIAWCFS